MSTYGRKHFMFSAAASFSYATRTGELEREDILHITIKDLPKDERPYEKFLKYGPDSLTDTELLAVILKSGTADKTVVDVARLVMLQNDNTYSILSVCRKSYEDLVKIPGVGKVKAITLKCIAELSKRISRSGFSERPKFENPAAVADYYMESMRHLDHEEFKVIYLNSANGFICDKTITSGTVNRSIVSPREVFIKALQVEAVNMILLHNHPSGSVMPSSEDIRVTREISKAGRLLSIKVLDHIIIGDRKYISLRERSIESAFDEDECLI